MARDDDWHMVNVRMWKKDLRRLAAWRKYIDARNNSEAIRRALERVDALRKKGE